jgi:mannobiose 2-epimerase
MYANWTDADPVASYGHDIESAWLLIDAAQELGDETLLATVKEIAVHLVDTQIEEGLNSKGVLTYEQYVNPEKGWDRNLEWWTQAEAINAFFWIYDITHDETYINRADVLWRWMKANMIDHEYGEWIRTVRDNGTVERTFDKIDLWKCPYHNVRMGIQAYERIHWPT